MSMTHAFRTIGLVLSTGWLASCATIGENEIEPGSASPPAVLVPLKEAERPSGWTGWRGFGRDGVVAGISLPDPLAPVPWPERWRVPVGAGFSGPIAADGRVYCHSRRGEEEVVTSHDARTGKVVWSQALAVAPWSQPFDAFGISDGPLATPTLVNGRLYTVSIHGQVTCFDAAGGRILFTIDPQELDGQPSTYRYGHASSPLVRSGQLYFCLASGSGGQLVAADAETGHVRWRAISESVTYASPVAARIQGVDHIIVRSWERIVGLDPGRGDILWEHAARADGIRRDLATPLVVGNVVYVTNDYHGTIALRIERHQTGTWSAERIFRSGALGGRMASPVYRDGYLYGLHQGSRFVCMDARTGERQWIARGFGKYASIIALGDRILLLDERGTLALILLSAQEFTLVQSWSVGSYTWAQLGIDASSLYLRDGDDLVALAF